MGKCNNKFKNKNLATSIMYGGLGYGSLCIPDKITDVILIILFPPLYIIVNQIQKKYFDFKEIIINIILTSMFYFPGFIHALHIMKKRRKSRKKR